MSGRAKRVLSRVIRQGYGLLSYGKYLLLHEGHGLCFLPVVIATNSDKTPRSVEIHLS